MTTPIDITPATVAAMLEGVTDGPWLESETRLGWWISVSDAPFFVVDTKDDEGRHGAIEKRADARFIAYAREAVPALSAERDAFRAVLEGAEYGWIDGIAKKSPEQSYALGVEVKERTLGIIAERDALESDVTTYQDLGRDLIAIGEALSAKLAEVTAERSSLSAMFATQAEETQAAKARVAELEALIRGKTFTVDESVELKAENERLRTPQGAAKVLLTISDVEIKPAAKALQDAFNLKGIGWKRYLSALRAAITALQETKP